MKKFLVNVDTNDYGIGFFLNRVYKEKLAQGETITEADLYPFIDQYCGFGITDLLVCINCQYSIGESNVFTDGFTKYERTEELGKPVDYKEWFDGLYHVYKDFGLDPLAVWFKRSRDLGFFTWMSVRMNDCHHPEREVSYMRTDFIYDAIKNGMTLGEKYDYFKNCLDFSYEKVRETTLNYLDEQLGRYDVDGIEFDFMREILCFNLEKTENPHLIMNDFLRKARAIVEKYEEKYGHKIKVAIRLNRDMTENKAFGFDVKTYEKEKLVHAVVVSPRWQSNDSDMPIKAWKSTLKDTEIYAAVDTLSCANDPRCASTPEVIRGFVNRYLSDGADGMYYFNYYTHPFTRIPGEEVRNVLCHEVFNTCKDLKTVQKLSRRYLVTFQDTCPEGYTPYQPLPVKLDGKTKTLNLNLGSLKGTKSVSLFVGLKGLKPEGVKIKANSKEINGLVRKDPKPSNLWYVPEKMNFTCNCGYVPEGSLTYVCHLPLNKKGAYNLEFSGETGEVTYLEFYTEKTENS